MGRTGIYLIENRVIHFISVGGMHKLQRTSMKRVSKEKEINLHGLDRATCEFLCEEQTWRSEMYRRLSLAKTVHMVNTNNEIIPMHTRQRPNGANVIHFTGTKPFCFFFVFALLCFCLA